MAEQDKRLALVRISAEILLDLLRIPEGETWVRRKADGSCIETKCIADAIPATAHVVAVTAVPGMQDIEILIADESYDELLSGCRVPYVTPVYQEKGVKA